MISDLTEEMERRYLNDPLFHARVERVVQVMAEIPVGDPRKVAAALGVLMAERDPMTGEPSRG